jgi:hypothetical protein
MSKFVGKCFKLAGQGDCDPPALMPINGVSADVN